MIHEIEWRKGVKNYNFNWLLSFPVYHFNFKENVGPEKASLGATEKCSVFLWVTRVWNKEAASPLSRESCWPPSFPESALAGAFWHSGRLWKKLDLSSSVGFYVKQKQPSIWTNSWWALSPTSYSSGTACSRTIQKWRIIERRIGNIKMVSFRNYFVPYMLYNCLFSPRL